MTCVVTVFLAACTKPPIARFVTDKESYLAGEVIQLTNTSSRAAHYRWVLPDGTESEAQDVFYPVNGHVNDTTLSFTLESSSDNGKATSTVTRSVLVKGASLVTITGSYVIGVYPVDVFLNGVYAGTLYGYNDPALDAARTSLVMRLRIGTYELKSVNAVHTQYHYFQISKGGYPVKQAIYM